MRTPGHMDRQMDGRTDGQVGSVPMEARVRGAEHETVVKDLPVELCDGAWRFVVVDKLFRV